MAMFPPKMVEAAKRRGHPLAADEDDLHLSRSTGGDRPHLCTGTRQIMSASVTSFHNNGQGKKMEKKRVLFEC